MPRKANSEIMTSEELQEHKRKLRRMKYERRKERIASMSPGEQEAVRLHENGIKRRYWRNKHGAAPQELKKTPEERSAYKVQWAKEKRQRARKELFDRYGGKCACCGVSDYRWLTLHHKNRDGGRERKVHEHNPANRLYHLVKQPLRDDLELLCYNCHLATDFFGGCPHQDPSSGYFISNKER